MLYSVYERRATKYNVNTTGFSIEFSLLFLLLALLPLENLSKSVVRTPHSLHPTVQFSSLMQREFPHRLQSLLSPLLVAR